MRAKVYVALATMAPIAGLMAVPATAVTTAQVRIVDRFNHGQVKVWVNHTTHYLAYGHRTGYFPVTPDPSRNDGVSVESVRYPSCGTGSPGWYFRAGHSYRIVVTAAGSCTVHGVKHAVPQFTITKVS